MNGLKTFLLLSCLTAVLLWAGHAAGGTQGMTFALVIAFVTNFVAYWFSDKIVLAMYGAKEVK